MGRYWKWAIVVYLLAMMWLSFSIVSIPGERYDTLTTSDSGWVYDEAKVINSTNGLAETNPWSHAPYGWKFEPQQLQPLLAVMIYRGVHALSPSVSLMDVVRFYGPFLFCLTLIPVYLTARELGGRAAGIFAVFFMATMVSTIYWHKIGAFDREPTITLFASWTFYGLVRLFKTNRETLARDTLLAGLLMGLFLFCWTGALYITAALALGIIFVLLLAFGGKLMKRFDDLYGAAYHAIKTHFQFLLGCIAVLVIATIVYCGLTGLSPNFWIGFSTTMLGYLGIPLGGGAGIAFPRYASEMQAPSSLNDVIGSFYRDPLITNIVLLFVGVTLILCIWKRQRPHLLLLATLIVLLALIWPGKGQARFERVWWPFVPVMAGLGAATIVRWLRDLSFDPNWEWLKSFQRPLLVLVVVLFFSAAFFYNAVSAARVTTPPTEWHGIGLDPALMEAFDWIQTNTSENDIISIQWSFGHLLTGATDRMTVVDGTEVTAQEGTWENNPSFTPRPPDYIYYVKNGRAYMYGVNEGARAYTVNGRRPDIQFFPYSTENELRWYLKTYRDEYGVCIDYILFTIDEISNAYKYYQYWEPVPILLGSPELRSTTSITQEGNKLVFNFGSGRERVVVDQNAGRAYVESGGSQQELDGFAFLFYNPSLIGGRRFDYSAQFYSPSSPAIDETLLVFVNNNQVTQAKLVEGVSAEVSNRELPVAIRDVGGIDFLDEVFTSSNQYVRIYKVNHSVIT